jgi:hypothetical protein
MVGESQSQPGHSGEEKNSQPLSGLEPPIIQPVAQCYSTDLSRILVKNRENFTFFIFALRNVDPVSTAYLFVRARVWL